MGRPKLLLPYRGGTVLGALLAALRAGGASPLVVVAAATNTDLRAWCTAANEKGLTGAASQANVANATAASSPASENSAPSHLVAGLTAPLGTGPRQPPATDAGNPSGLEAPPLPGTGTLLPSQCLAREPSAPGILDPFGTDALALPPPGTDALPPPSTGILPRSAAAPLPPTLAGALRLAINEAPERGMLSSILTGLEALGGADELARRGVPLLVTPGDLPALRATTVAVLLRQAAAASAQGVRLAVPVYRGRRGHPLFIAAALLPEIPRLDPARGLRHLLDLHAGELLEVDTGDPGCITDLDTSEDYARLSAAEATR